jgi:hypothetical protein
MTVLGNRQTPSMASLSITPHAERLETTSPAVMSTKETSFPDSFNFSIILSGFTTKFTFKSIHSYFSFAATAWFYGKKVGQLSEANSRIQKQNKQK